jgi:hypothetical protein
VNDTNCQHCGGANFYKGSTDDKDSSAKLDEACRVWIKSETKRRLGALGEGAFHHPAFRGYFLAATVGVGVYISWKFSGGWYLLILAPVIGAISGFASASHISQKEIRAEADALRDSAEICAGCGKVRLAQHRANATS